MDVVGSPDRSVVGQITVRYWASARAAAGLAEERVDVVGPVTLAALLAEVVERHGADSRLARVVPVCSALLGDRPVGSADPATLLVRPGQVVELLPPFAGG